MSDPHTDLYLQADKKIDEIRLKTERLMAEDLDLRHKMDLVIQRQDQLKERFEATSNTGFKTFEMVQSLHKDFGDLMNRMTLNEKDTRIAQQEGESANRKYDRVITGIFVTVFLSVFGLAMNFILSKKYERDQQSPPPLVSLPVKR